jgi:hypothetical protein
MNENWKNYTDKLLRWEKEFDEYYKSTAFAGMSILNNYSKRNEVLEWVKEKHPDWPKEARKAKGFLEGEKSQREADELIRQKRLVVEARYWFHKSLEQKGYRFINGDSTSYAVHPDYLEEVEKRIARSEYLDDWLKTLPEGAVISLDLNG